MELTTERNVANSRAAARLSPQGSTRSPASPTLGDNPITNTRTEGAGASLTAGAKSFASCSDCAERTGFRFETEHVCRAFRGTERRTDDPLAPAMAPIRGSCR